MPSTYVVTGGAGFIGSHIAEKLLQEGHEVRVIDNLVSGKQSNIEHLQNLKGRFTFWEADILDRDTLQEIFNGAEVVFHNAALPSVPRSIANPLETHTISATGTLNVLSAACNVGVRRVVYAASSSAYGDIGAIDANESMFPQPISPYGVAKLTGEYYCRIFPEIYGLETVCLRYFNAFGERQDPASEYAAVIPKFITMMLKGQQPTIFGNGEQSRDFIYVGNIVHANLLAATEPGAVGAVMNIATGQRVTLIELVKTLNEVMGTDLQPTFLEERPGDILHSTASIEKAGQLLGFEPIINFREGLARTVRWYRKQIG